MARVVDGRYAGWEESDYGNLADPGWTAVAYDMNHMPGTTPLPQWSMLLSVTPLSQAGP